MPSAIAAQAYGDNAGLAPPPPVHQARLFPAQPIFDDPLRRRSPSVENRRRTQSLIREEWTLPYGRTDTGLHVEDIKKNSCDAAEAGEQHTSAYSPGRFSAVMGIAIG
jgi:hypothetical protein